MTFQALGFGSMPLPAGRPLSSPLDVFWTLSGLCNLTCSFCMTGSGPRPARPSLGPEDRARIATELIDARVLKVYLTGGEPLVLPDTPSLVETLSRAGIALELTTNGTHLDAATCRWLATVPKLSVQVSLNGSSARVNDPLMGPGSFERIRQGIVTALAHGLDLHVRPTVQAGNVADLPELIEALAALGVPRIDLRELTPLGRAAGDFAAQRPDPEALARLEDFCRDFSHPVTRVQFESWSLAFARQGHPALCTLGEERPATVLIDEGGHLAGCSATFYMGFENPVLGEGGLGGAWLRLTRLSALRDPTRLGGECGTCDLVSDCRGGCRAAAARLTGDPWAPDPLCPRVEVDRVVDPEGLDLTLWKAL